MFGTDLLKTLWVHDVEMTLRRIDIITTSCACWEFGPPCPPPPKILNLDPPPPPLPQYSKPSYAYATVSWAQQTKGEANTSPFAALSFATHLQLDWQREFSSRRMAKPVSIPRPSGDFLLHNQASLTTRIFSLKCHKIDPAHCPANKVAFLSFSFYFIYLYIQARYQVDQQATTCGGANRPWCEKFEYEKRLFNQILKVLK